MSDIYLDLIKEYFDMSDIRTVKQIVSVTEAEKDQVLSSMANKLYNSIVDRITEIDFGQIPQSRGDITKVPNYIETVECVNNIREILVKFNQPTDCVDTVLTAISNIRNGKSIFEKSFAVKSGIGTITYNTMVLSIISAVSLLISTSIEFIKEPNDNTYKTYLDKVSLYKTKDSLLFDNLRSFNNNYNEIMKSIKESNSKTTQYQEASELPFMEAILPTVIVTGIGAMAFTIGLLRILLPLLHTTVEFLYNMRQTVANYFEIQARLLELNMEGVNYSCAKSSKEKEVIIKKQKKIADKFRSISNKLAVKMKIAETETEANIEINRNDKMTYNNGISLNNSTTSNTSSIF